MRFLSALIASLALTHVSAQLPASSIQAWYDSLSTNPQNTYAPVAIAGGGQAYAEPTSAITQWSDPAFYTGAPGWLDSAPTFDPLQYRMPDATFNVTLADGYPRAWHVWFPQGYVHPKGHANDASFYVSPANVGRFSVWYALHGFTDNAFYPYYDGEQEWPGMPIWSNLTAFTYHNKYILVAPEGFLNRQNIVSGEVYPEFAWNAGLCCSSEQVDDVAFLTYVRNNITAMFQPKRQYLTGYSNGAFMVERMACEKRELFDAFVANAGPVDVAGTSAAEILANCDASHAATSGPAKPILLVHGRNDQRVSYQGNGGYVSEPDNFAAWAARNGCPDTPSAAKKLYDSSNPGLTSNLYFSTLDATYGYPVLEFPPEVDPASWHTLDWSKYYGLRRLPFSPSTQSYQGDDCATVELVSHYDYHVWPKKTTSVADDWIYSGNGIFDLNEYAHSFFQRVAPANKQPLKGYQVHQGGNGDTRKPGKHADRDDYAKIQSHA